MRLAVDIDGTLNDADTWALVLAKRFAKKHGIKMKLNLKAFDYSEKFFGGDKKAESLQKLETNLQNNRKNQKASKNLMEVL